MTTSEERALKSCPFCGRDDIHESSESGYYGAFWVVCEGCGACTSEVGIASQAEANERWNTRASLATTEGAEAVDEAMRLANVYAVAYVDFEKASVAYAVAHELLAKMFGAEKKLRAHLVANLAAHPPAPSEAVKWLPIETAPKDGSEFLTYKALAGTFDIGYWQRSRERFCAISADEYTTHTFDLWQPLPSTPTQGAPSV